LLEREAVKYTMMIHSAESRAAISAMGSDS
jgi:hypothetical protein